MKNIDVRIVKLEAMWVAATHGFGASPEESAWQQLGEWAQQRGYADGPYRPRFFGFNNPDPSPASPNYGYEQWLTVSVGETGSDAVEIKEVPGGTYAVTRFQGLEHIGQVWKELVAWVENSEHEWAAGQCLEELLTVVETPLQDYIFDLYLPISA